MLSNKWCRSVVVLVGVLGTLGAAHRTENFRVEAPSAEIAEHVGRAAERHRKELALTWLGQELPPCPQPCLIQVKVTLGACRGKTSVVYDKGKVISQAMDLEGALDRLLATVLPHETTHLVFAHYFGRPAMRWADEGGAAFSEDLTGRSRRDTISREIMDTPGRAIPLQRLLRQREYSGDSTALYSQGYSLVRFLVESSSRPAFLAFVAEGMRRDDWDAAVKAHYQYRSVEELEQAWLRSQKLASTGSATRQ